MRKIVVVIIALLLVGGVAYFLIGPSGMASSLRPSPTPPAAQPSNGAVTQVSAQGEVLPVNSAELNFAAQGIVSEVLVSEGDLVKQDQVLLRLDSKRQAAAVAQSQAALDRARSGQAAAESTLARAQANLADLKAGPRSQDIALAAAALTVAQAQLARLQAGADTTSLTEATANMDKAARAVQQAQFAYDRVKDTPFGSIGPEALRLEQTTLDYKVAKTTYEQLVLGPRDIDVNVLKAQVSQAEAALAQSQAGARPEAVTAMEAEAASADANVKAATADVAAAEAALRQAQAMLADTELRAPFDGTVVTLNVKRGESTPLGSSVVRLADLSHWKVETKDLTEVSVGRLEPGDVASMEFDALPDVVLTGTVTRIDYFGTNRQGDIVYAVTITPGQWDNHLRWHMTASVAIQPGP